MKVGDTVTLNDYGLESVFGSPIGLAHMKTKRMTITRIENWSLTTDEDTFEVEVDDPEVNKFWLTHHDFDVVAT